MPNHLHALLAFPIRVRILIALLVMENASWHMI